MSKKNENPDLLLDYHLLSYDEIDSTSEEARRLAKNGGQHGAFVWAKSQTHGRGRYGRQWISEPGNLFVSILLTPNCEIEKATQLSFVAALAAQETISQIVPPGPSVTSKWPNDILVDGRKIAGILLESFQEDGKFWVVIGVGVNVDSSPEGTTFPATCLKEEGVEIVSAKIVLSRFIHQFVAQYNIWQQKGFAPIRRAWMKTAWNLGEPILAALPNEEIQGIFKEISTDGALIVMQNGKRRTVHAADVFPCEREIA